MTIFSNDRGYSHGKIQDNQQKTTGNTGIVRLVAEYVSDRGIQPACGVGSGRYDTGL